MLDDILPVSVLGPVDYCSHGFQRRIASASLVGMKRGRHVRHARCRNRAHQIACWIAFAVPLLDAIAEHLADLARTLCAV